MGEGPGPARQRMLDAAMRVWGEASTADVFAGLSVTEVARAAGVTRSTFYAHWPTTEAYLVDLIAHLADPVWGSTPADIASADSVLGRGGLRLLDRLLAACEGHVHALLDDPAFPVRMALMSRVSDPTLVDSLRTAQLSAAGAYGRQTTQLDALWGRVMRPPFEPQQLLMMLGAMAEGTAQLHRLDPERFPTAIYGLAAMSLLMVATRHRADTRTVHEVLEAVNDWPTARPATVPSSSPIDTSPLSDAEIRVILAETRRLADSEGWIELSMARLAAQTSTPESRLLRAFGSRAGLALAAYLLAVSERFDAVVPTDDAMVDLRVLLAIKVDELQRTSVFAQSLASILSGGSTYARPHSFDFDPRPRLVAAIGRAQSEGGLDPTIDPGELASILDDTVLVSNLRLTARTAVATDPVELVLRGAGAPPVPGPTAPVA